MGYRLGLKDLMNENMRQSYKSMMASKYERQQKNEEPAPKVKMVIQRKSPSEESLVVSKPSDLKGSLEPEKYQIKTVDESSET